MITQAPTAQYSTVSVYRITPIVWNDTGEIVPAQTMYDSLQYSRMNWTNRQIQYSIHAPCCIVQCCTYLPSSSSTVVYFYFYCALLMYGTVLHRPPHEIDSHRALLHVPRGNLPTYSKVNYHRRLLAISKRFLKKRTTIAYCQNLALFSFLKSRWYAIAVLFLKNASTLRVIYILL